MVDPSLVKHLQAELLAAKEERRAKEILLRLKECRVTPVVLMDTMVGKSVKRVCKRFPALKSHSKSLIDQWRLLLSSKRPSPTTSSDPTRQCVLTLLKQVIPNPIIASSLEFSLFRANTPSDYRSKARSLRFNLSKNTSLLERFLSGNLTPDALAAMSTLEMATEDQQKKRETVQREQTEARRLDWNVVNDKPRNGLFQCEKCSSRWTMTEQKQILSADEPMTIFVKCMECSNSWQF